MTASKQAGRTPRGTSKVHEVSGQARVDIADLGPIVPDLHVLPALEHHSRRGMVGAVGEGVSRILPGRV